MVRYRGGKVAVRSETENAALRVDERNRDLSTTAPPVNQLIFELGGFTAYLVRALSENGTGTGGTGSRFLPLLVSGGGLLHCEGIVQRVRLS